MEQYQGAMTKGYQEVKGVITSKTYDETLSSAELPSAWQGLRTQTQKALTDLKANRFFAKAEQYETTFTLLAEDYEQQGHYHYAAGLYQYLLRLTKDDKNNNKATGLEAKLQKTENAFIQSLGLDPNHNPHPYQSASPKHHQALTHLRQWAQSELDKIDQTFSYDIYDEEKMKGQEDKAHDLQLQKALATQKLYHTLTQKQKAFITQMVTECIDVLGKSPCGYAIMGLGSLAREEATPYSDFEFAILIEEEKEDYKPYFRHLTQLLHLKVINLGETILPSLAIPALNDYYSEEIDDCWFFDNLMPRGFAFDGAMPQACKTPLGKHDKQGNIIYELIHSPEVMVQFLGKKANDANDKYWFDYEPHLSMILVTACLLEGQSDLFHTFEEAVIAALKKPHTSENIALHQVWALELLRGEDFLASISDGGDFTISPHGLNIPMQGTKLKGDIQEFKLNPGSEEEEGKLYDVKKEIYRLPDRTLERLAIYYGVRANTAWDRIETMCADVNLDAEGATHLKIIVAITIELRLRAYLMQGGQQEKMLIGVTLPAEEVVLEHIARFFKLPNLSQLFRFYYTALPLYELVCYFCLRTFSRAEQLKAFKDFVGRQFYDNSFRVKANVYKRLLHYQKASDCLQQWIVEHPWDTTALSALGGLYYKLNQFDQAIQCWEKVLEENIKLDNNRLHPNTASALNNLGIAHRACGQFHKAIEYDQEALAIRQKLYGEQPHVATAASLNNLGYAYHKLGQYVEAIIYHEQALSMRKKLHGEQLHPDIAYSLNNLGIAYEALGQFNKAKTYHKQALKMKRKLYGDQPHPLTASSLNNLGSFYFQLGEFDKAIKYHLQVLVMNKKLYANQSHTDIAGALNNLGCTYAKLGQYNLAMEYHAQALVMRKKLYNEQPHSEIADSLHNLGQVCYALGQFDEAIDYDEEALALRRILYYPQLHPDILFSLIKIPGLTPRVFLSCF